MGFVGNLVLLAAVKEFCKSIRIDKVMVMVRVAPFLTNSVVVEQINEQTFYCTVTLGYA